MELFMKWLRLSLKFFRWLEENCQKTKMAEGKGKWNKYYPKICIDKFMMQVLIAKLRDFLDYHHLPVPWSHGTSISFVICWKR